MNKYIIDIRNFREKHFGMGSVYVFKGDHSIDLSNIIWKYKNLNQNWIIIQRPIGNIFNFYGINLLINEKR